jgi:hypothetical protein
MGAPATDEGSADNPPSAIEDEEATRELTSGGLASLDAVAAAERDAELAEAAFNDVEAEVAAAQSGIVKPLDRDARR